MFIDATVTQAKTGSGNTYLSHLPGWNPKTKDHVQGNVVRTFKSIERHYADLELIVMKTHDFNYFKERLREFQKMYNIVGCRLYVNLRDPVDQLASNYVQQNRKEGVDVAASPNIEAEWQNWTRHGQLVQLWQGSADLFKSFTGHPITWVLESGLPTMYYSLPGSEFKNCTLHVHRTEQLSKPDKGCGSQGVSKQQVVNIKSGKSKLKDLACEHILNQREKNSGLPFKFCVAWSDCCAHLKK